MKRWKLTLYMRNDEYRKLRVATMRQDFNAATFIRHSNGEVTFKTKGPRLLCKQLEKIMDFGATSAREVLGVY